MTIDKSGESAGFNRRFCGTFSLSEVESKGSEQRSLGQRCSGHASGSFYRGFGARSSAWQKGNAGMNIAHGEQHKGRVHPWLAKILFSEDRFLHGRSKQAA